MRNGEAGPKAGHDAARPTLAPVQASGKRGTADPAARLDAARRRRRLAVLVNRHDWAMVAHERALSRLAAIHAEMEAMREPCPAADPECLRGEGGES